MNGKTKLALWLVVAVAMAGIVAVLKRPEREKRILPKPLETRYVEAQRPNREPMGARSSEPRRVGESTFATLRVLDRDRYLMEVRKRPLPEIFQLMLEAGRVDRDWIKQSSLSTILALALQDQKPSPELRDEWFEFLVDASNSERELLAGALCFARTVEALEVLLRVLENTLDVALRDLITNSIGSIGGRLHDGRFRGELAPPLMDVWTRLEDEVVLTNVAKAIAEIGTRDGVARLLYQIEIDPEQKTARARAATRAFYEATMHNPEAVTPLYSAMGRLPPDSAMTRLVSDTLQRIGTESASNALLAWLQGADASKAPLALEYARATRTPPQLEVWELALDPSTVFRSEKIRDAIRQGVELYKASIGFENP